MGIIQNLDISTDFIKIHFANNDKIKEIKAGDNHNLFLTTENKLYANGDNSIGQVNGNLNDDTFNFECTPVLIPLEDEVISIKAKNWRSAAKLKNGKVYYWGGFHYLPKISLRKLPKYNGLNCFNDEEGIIDNDLEILDFGLGLYHDILLVKETNSINI